MVNKINEKVIDKLLRSDGLDGMRPVMAAVFGAHWEANESLCGTPRRFLKYLGEFIQPINIDDIFHTFPIEEKHPGMVIQSRIPFRMVCEHHLLPATGVAALGYVPHERVIGLSKMTRLVQAVGTEIPSLQEHITQRIIDLMDEHLKPKGTMIITKATHGCMACRGVNSPEVVTTSSCVSGIFRDVLSAREEFLSLIQTEMGM